MRNAAHVFRREYLERVRSKSFVIITILTPLIFVVIVGLPILLAGRPGQRQRVAVVETGRDAGRLFGLLQERLGRGEGAPADAPSRSGRLDPRPSFQLRQEKIEPGREAETRKRLQAEVLAERLDAFLWVDGDPTAGGRVEYSARNVTDFVALRTLENAVSSAVVKMRLTAHGIQPTDVEGLVKPVRLRTVRVTQQGSREDRGLATFMTSYFFVFVLYVTLALYGVAVMRSVIEEKASRIFEVLLASVRPIELLAGKILGVAAVGLTQYLAWTVLALLAGGGFGLAAVRAQLGDISLPGAMLFFFVLFFLLGFLLYSTMFAALGAMVNSEQEAQQLQILIMQFLIIPMLLLPLVLRSPNGTTATALSLIPVFTPMLMFLRITLVTPPSWQIGLSVALLLGMNAAVLWASARIYRVGILMYGKRPTLPELVRWLRTA